MKAERFTQRLWELSCMIGGEVTFQEFCQSYEDLHDDIKQDDDLHLMLERNVRLIKVLERELEYAKGLEARDGRTANVSPPLSGARDAQCQ